MALKSTPTKMMSFGSVFRPLHYLARIWGLVPFSIATNSNGELQNPKIHLYDGLWLLTTVLLYMSFLNYAWNALNYDRKISIRNTWILILCARLLAVFAFVYGILTTIINMCNRYKLISLVKMCTRFDEEVCRIGLSSIFWHHLLLFSFLSRWQRLKFSSTTTLTIDELNYFASHQWSCQWFFRLHQCWFTFD